MVDIRTISTINPEVSQASLGYLIELMLALRSYKEGIVLVGGWVPYLLLKKYQSPGSSFHHVGSQDIDLAINPKRISQTEYADIAELVKSRGYQPNPKSSFSFLKSGPEIRGEKIPRDTNAIENVISYLNTRLKTLRRLRNSRSAQAITNLIVVNYRCKPLVNTKNKLKRGKSPFELATGKKYKFDWLDFIKKSCS